jgi:hypothetical protein
MLKAGVDFLLPTGSVPDRGQIACYVDRPDPEKFYSIVRDHFAKLPPSRWAVVDGLPVVWLGRASAFKDWEGFLESFKKDFLGRAPFLVAEESWGKIAADRRYALGALREHDVLSLRPGDAAAWQRSWSAVQRSGVKMILIESWDPEAVNFIPKWRKADAIAPPKGLWTGRKYVGFNLTYATFALGLSLVQNDDGKFALVETAGVKVLTTKEGSGERRYLYFDVDDSFWFWERRGFALEVEYLDLGEGSFGVEYHAPKEPYKEGGEESFTGTGEWKVATFQLRDAFFGNGQRGGGDFRIGVKGRGLSVRRVILKPK